MPTVFTELVVLPPPEIPPRKKWTRGECEFLDSLGFWESKHFELIDGELINKIGKNRPHVFVTKAIHLWLIDIFGFERVEQENPIDVAPEDNPASEPEPDLVVLREPSEHYRENPKPQDILLAIEVADSTLDFDLSKKARLYARAGIPDYWVFDIKKRRVIVHREPAGDNYRSIVEYREHESVTPLAASQAAFQVATAFGE
ncbi:MAG: Uma2 family endonuclease [Bryobacterales bacterium]|nr:Uma2 family endonuclease [Bryobacterales bacterium]MBV9401684.1 Uma2 family endonuclease [Bryobacterales bacterium]